MNVKLISTIIIYLYFTTIPLDGYFNEKIGTTLSSLVFLIGMGIYFLEILLIDRIYYNKIIIITLLYVFYAIISLSWGAINFTDLSHFMILVISALIIIQLVMINHVKT